MFQCVYSLSWYLRKFEYKLESIFKVHKIIYPTIQDVRIDKNFAIRELFEKSVQIFANINFTKYNLLQFYKKYLSQT